MPPGCGTIDEKAMHGGGLGMLIRIVYDERERQAKDSAILAIMDSLPECRVRHRAGGGSLEVTISTGKPRPAKPKEKPQP